MSERDIDRFLGRRRERHEQWMLDQETERERKAREMTDRLIPKMSTRSTTFSAGPFSAGMIHVETQCILRNDGERRLRLIMTDSTGTAWQQEIDL